MSSELPPPANKAAERLAVIVDAAERAALSVIDDAEKEAKRYLEEAQARADKIVAERLRETADQLEANGGEGGVPLRPVANQLEIDEQLPEVADEPPIPEEDAEAVVDPPAVATPPVEEKPVTPPPPIKALRPEPTPASNSGGGGGSAAARLLATQMAVSGSSRKEIEMRLRNGFEIEDTSEILDAILGPEE